MTSKVYRLLSKNPEFINRAPSKEITTEKFSYYFWECPLNPSEYQEVLAKCRSSLQRQETAFAFPWSGMLQAVFFDMDSTVIQEETIVELARIAGKAKEVSEMTEKAMAGELDFKKALTLRVRTLKGLPKKVIEQTQSVLNLQPGMQLFAKQLVKQKAKLYLVSGGFIELAMPIANSLGFEGSHANSLAINGEYLTGNLQGGIVDGHEKGLFVQGKMASEKFDSSLVAVIGDGANDQIMMQHADIAVGFRAKKALVPFLNGGIYDGDHSLGLKMLT